MNLRFTFSQTSSVGLIFLLLVSGCGKQNQEDQVRVSYDSTKFLVNSAFEGAKDVIDARKTTKDGEEIIIVGRIGGSLDPWVNGRAAFSIVDRSVKACSDETPDGEACNCETPWDYCCETDALKDAMALVKFVEGDGKVVPHGAREIFNLNELQTVFVKGTAKRDDSGNLTVLAKQMFKKPD